MAGHIFISYSKQDSEFAFKLADHLEASGRKVWIDRQIEGGERWRTSILQALRGAKETIVILSPRSANSDWVMHEGSVASGLEQPIYPVLMEPVNKLPVWMEELQYIDFHTKPFDDAFEMLIGALTPPNPLQDLLDQQLKAHQQTGELIGEALLHVIDEERLNLKISPEAEELISRSKGAVTYRRRLVRASAGAAIVLSVIALIAGVIAIRSGAEIATARGELTTARTEIAAAQSNLEDQEVELATAQAEQQQALAEVEIAQIEQATIQAQLATATASIGEANQELTEARTQLDTAKTQLQRLFDSTGTVPVGTQPNGLLWNGSDLWVATGSSANGTLLQIDVNRGMADQTVSVAMAPSAIAWDGTGIWAAFEDLDLVRYIDPADGTVLAELETGMNPYALTWDATAGALWVANRTDNTVQRISADDDAAYGWNVDLTVPVGASPRALAWTGSALWVANRDDNTLQRINPTTGETNTPLEVGKGPSALAWDGDSLWVANRTESTVMQINPTTRAITQTIAVNKFPSDLLWDGFSLWVINDGQDSVMQIDRETGEVLIEVEPGTNPSALAWDGESLWAANEQDRTVVRVRADQEAVLASMPLDDIPSALTVTENRLSIASSEANTVRHLNPATQPATQYTNELSAAPITMIPFNENVLVARDDNSLQQINPVTGNLTNRVTVERLPSDIAYDGRQLWIANAEEGVVFAVNPFSGVETGRTIAVGESPQALLWDGSRLWVANTGDGTVMAITGIGLVRSPVAVGEAPSALAWDGEYLWVANSGSNTVTRLNTETNDTETVTVGANPVALAWDGTSLWVACRDANTVEQIDTQTVAVQATVPVDEGPVALAWDGESLVVATRNSTLQRVNTQSLNLILLARQLALQTQF